MSNIPHHPPKWADKFLEWYCRPELLEEIQGDIYELFDKRCEQKGPTQASRRFVWDVFRSFRLSTIKQIQLNFLPMMLRTNFKIAFRQLRKQKMYSSIKIGGFALGIAACLLIGMFIRDELSYDTHIPEGDRIYRVIGVYDTPDGIKKGVHFPAPFAKALKDDYPEIEQVGRINPVPLFGAGSNQIRPADTDKNHYEEGFVYADQKILEIFQIPMAYGNRENALKEPNSIVISKRKAQKYFPDENPIGKLMIINNNTDQPLKIGGVMEGFPPNSHMDYEFLITLEEREFYPGEQSRWRANNYPTYILLQKGVTPQQLEDKLPGIVKKYIIPVMEEAGSVDAAKIAEKSSFELQPIKDIHLKSSGILDGMVHGDIRLIWLFGAIAVFILLIACVNFINLSTAKSANRAKEVGIRKVVGSFRSHLISQFLVESTVFSLFAFILGTLLAWTTLPWFNQLAGKSLSFPWQAWWFIPLIGGMVVVVGLIAGIYPAFYLSSFRPAQVLKGKLNLGTKSANMRSGLVVFQFATSIVLIIGTLVIYRQMNYVLNKKVGFDKEQVVLIQGGNTLGDKVQPFKQELLTLNDVINVTVSDYLPVRGTTRNGNTFWKEGKVREESGVPGQIWRVDHDYIKTMGINMVEGRDFSIEMPTDSQAIIISKSMASELGLDEPINKRITNGAFTWPIIGVLEDFHYESMKQGIRPLALVIGNSPATISAKVNTSNMQESIKAISSIWHQFSPNQPIRYTFLDERFAEMYTDVEITGKVFTSFSILAIIVACLGLFALSAFVAEQRSKEISIRKVLGASTKNIFRLLTQNFMLLVIISLAIAIPVGKYIMTNWLSAYEYRIDITWDVFVISGLIALIIAVSTISYQAIRTATSNPADTLRSE